MQEIVSGKCYFVETLSQQGIGVDKTLHAEPQRKPGEEGVEFNPLLPFSAALRLCV
jgi:hypothetical protein